MCRGDRRYGTAENPWRGVQAQGGVTNYVVNEVNEWTTVLAACVGVKAGSTSRPAVRWSVNNVYRWDTQSI